MASGFTGMGVLTVGSMTPLFFRSGGLMTIARAGNEKRMEKIRRWSIFSLSWRSSGDQRWWITVEMASSATEGSALGLLCKACSISGMDPWVRYLPCRILYGVRWISLAGSATEGSA